MTRRIVATYAVFCIAILVMAVAALVVSTPSRPTGYDSFSLSAISFVEGDDGFTVYDDDDIYWVFAHRRQLCEAAESVGRDGVVSSVLTAGAITTDEATTYLRGMLRGCA